MASEDVIERAEHWSEAMRGHNPATVSTLIAVELVDSLTAEVRELREDLVWAVQSAAIATNVFDGCQYLDWDGYDFDQDGTPDSICRAVREARDGS